MFNLFGKKTKKIFEGLEASKSNFKIVATHVRVGKKRRNYIFNDSRKFNVIVEKWQFEPHNNPISRCGQDYQLVFTNGDLNIPISICFICKTLVFNGIDKYRISERHILRLLEEDFTIK